MMLRQIPHKWIGLLAVYFICSCEVLPRSPDGASFPVLKIHPKTGHIAWVTPGPFLHYRLVVLDSDLIKIDSIAISTARVRSVVWSTDGNRILATTSAQEVIEFTLREKSLEMLNLHRLDGLIVMDGVSVDNKWHVAIVTDRGANEGQVGILETSSGNIIEPRLENREAFNHDRPYYEIALLNGLTSTRLIVRATRLLRVYDAENLTHLMDIETGPRLQDAYSEITVADRAVVGCRSSGQCTIFNNRSLAERNTLDTRTRYIRGIAASSLQLYWFVHDNPKLFRTELNGTGQVQESCELRANPRAVIADARGLLVGYPDGTLERIGTEHWGGKRCVVLQSFVP